jgi:hypothetical protein
MQVKKTVEKISPIPEFWPRRHDHIVKEQKEVTDMKKYTKFQAEDLTRQSAGQAVAAATALTALAGPVPTAICAGTKAGRYLPPVIRNLSKIL